MTKDKSKSDQPKEIEVNWWILVLSVLFVTVAWLVTFNSFDYSFFDINLDPNEFGDMFGGLNALFSGLAFAGIIFTIYLQRKELELQRQELNDTRQVLKDQKKEMGYQSETLKMQRFENTFFSLLDTFNGIIESLYASEACQGRSVFSGINRDPVREAVSRHQGSDDFYNRLDMTFGPYFRVLYNIIRFVERSDIEDKRFYVHLLRDQLTSYEVLHLAYFGMRKEGKDDFKNLITKYALLKKLPSDPALLPLFEQHYGQSAFN